jgi:hypothetical protein
MKMGTIASPWRDDAAAAKTILPYKQRRTTILRYALPTTRRRVVDQSRSSTPSNRDDIRLGFFVFGGIVKKVAEIDQRFSMARPTQSHTGFRPLPVAISKRYINGRPSHNLEVSGSNPLPATNSSARPQSPPRSQDL